MIDPHPGARTSGQLSRRVFWDSKYSRFPRVAATPDGEAGFSLARARRRRRSGAPARVGAASGPFFGSRRVPEAAVRIPFWWLDLAALATAGSGSGWEAAAGVSGRWRRVRGGSEWIFLVLAFLGKRGRYTTALGLLVRSMASRSSSAGVKCSSAVWGASTGLNKLAWWPRCLACKLPLELRIRVIRARRRFYPSGSHI